MPLSQTIGDQHHGQVGNERCPGASHVAEARDEQDVDEQCDLSIASGARELFAQNPVTLLVTFGGFLTNMVYCLWMNKKNGTGGEIRRSSSKVLVNNLLFCALAGLLWYSQFFGLGMGQSFFEPGSVMMAFSWSILMSLNVLFSNVWGIILKEWRGAGKKAVFILAIGMAVLIFSLIVPNLF